MVYFVPWNPWQVSLDLDLIVKIISAIYSKTGMIQKNAAYLYTGMGVTFFLLFCLFYDKRRRDDPDYKERIRVRM